MLDSLRELINRNRLRVVSVKEPKTLFEVDEALPNLVGDEL